MKTMTLTLVGQDPFPTTTEGELVFASYRVIKATDTIAYPPGSILDRGNVRDLCASARWKISIVEQK